MNNERSDYSRSSREQPQQRSQDPSTSKREQQQQQQQHPQKLQIPSSSSKQQQQLRSHGTTEHDAVNNRFIERKESEVAYCLSCRSEFTVSLTNDIIQHYVNRRHEPCCRCLYCNGPMYRYLDAREQLQFYHDCHRWKRSLDPNP